MTIDGRTAARDWLHIQKGWISASLLDVRGNVWTSTHTCRDFRRYSLTPYVVDVTISATKDWQSTALTVKPGQAVLVKFVSGGWSWHSAGTYRPDTDNSNSNSIVQNAGFSAVIGRIGSGEPFFVNLRDPIPVSSAGFSS